MTDIHFSNFKHGIVSIHGNMTSRAAFKHSYIKQSKDVYSWRRVMWKNTQVHFKTKHNGLASLIRL